MAGYQDSYAPAKGSSHQLGAQHSDIGMGAKESLDLAVQMVGLGVTVLGYSNFFREADAGVRREIL